jgi:synaptobrevin family protein YKT6
MRVIFSALYKTGATAPDKDGPPMISVAKELSSFSYFQRSSFGEMCTFFARTFANNKSLAPGARTSVKQQGFLCHMYVSPHGVTAVCFADEEYPARVAFGYLSKLCTHLLSHAARTLRDAGYARPTDGRCAPRTRDAGEDFVGATGGQPVTSNEDNSVPSFQAAHTKLLVQFQDPTQADQLTKIMADLEQTKLVLHETIEAALERGQKIDDLIVKSNDLSGSSKMFYKTARKQNQCCTYM